MLDLGGDGENGSCGEMRPEEILVGLSPRKLRAHGQKQLAG